MAAPWSWSRSLSCVNIWLLSLCNDWIIRMPGLKQSTIHVIRVSLLEPFVTGFRRMGAPVDHLLDRAGISPEFLALARFSKPTFCLMMRWLVWSMRVTCSV